MKYTGLTILVRHDNLDDPDSPLVGELLDNLGQVLYTHYKKYKIAFKYDPKDKYALYTNNKRLLETLLYNEIHRELINGTIDYPRSGRGC